MTRSGIGIGRFLVARIRHLKWGCAIGVHERGWMSGLRASLAAIGCGLPWTSAYGLVRLEASGMLGLEGQNLFFRPHNLTSKTNSAKSLASRAGSNGRFALARVRHNIGWCRNLQ